jgi:hypothetical protein
VFCFAVDNGDTDNDPERARTPREEVYPRLAAWLSACSQAATLTA